VAEVRLRTVDAFTDRPFTGNPGAVVMLDEIPSDDWMAAVARETNLSDTGFVIRQKQPDADFLLRWFTRGGVEVDLCGHVTKRRRHRHLRARRTVNTAEGLQATSKGAKVRTQRGRGTVIESATAEQMIVVYDVCGKPAQGAGAHPGGRSKLSAGPVRRATRGV
jgi:PhzF family phenazine biosynthesis protein